MEGVWKAAQVEHFHGRNTGVSRRNQLSKRSLLPQEPGCEWADANPPRAPTCSAFALSARSLSSCALRATTSAEDGPPQLPGEVTLPSPSTPARASGKSPAHDNRGVAGELHWENGAGHDNHRNQVPRDTEKTKDRGEGKRRTRREAWWT